MAQKLEQTQAAVQTQQLSTMQVAVAKLVELPITELATRVRDEMVDNAALEESDADHFADNTADNSADMGNDMGASDANDKANDDIDAPNAYEETENYGREADAMGDYFSADDVPSYLLLRLNVTALNFSLQVALPSTKNCNVK